MSDVYQAPESDLVVQTEYDSSEYGSIEDAITGNYKFEIGEVLSEAWAKVSGSKGAFFLAFIMMYVIMIGAIMISFAILAADTGSIGSIISQLIINIIILPLLAGLFIMGIKRSVDAPISATNIFQHFNKAPKLFVGMILMQLLIFIGYLLLILPGIYLTIAYFMAIPLIAEKDMGIWEALETSRKAVTKRWFSFLLFFIIMTIIFFISSIPFGIGLIWTFPMFVIAYGIIYRNMFGVNPETLEQ